jgi:hypothetical protein
LRWWGVESGARFGNRGHYLLKGSVSNRLLYFIGGVENTQNLD